MLAMPGEDGVFTLGYLQTGSAQKGEEAALNIAFAGLSVGGMEKHL